MGNSKLYVLFLAFFLLNGSILHGQDDVSKQPLSEVLSQLQTRYDHNFNYFEDTIENISVVPPDADFSLDEALDDLRTKTGLLFTKLQDNFISVKARGTTILCGYLRDKDTQEPLVSATIQGLKSAAISDGNGYFELTISSLEEEINIRYLGYRTFNRKAKYFRTDGCQPIFLREQQMSLSQVLLSNYLVEGINKLNTGDIEFSKVNFKITGV